MAGPDFNDINISEECLRCREKVISKSKHGTFDVECTGIFPADYKLSQKINRPLTDSEKENAGILLDPVGWAKEVLSWEPRVSRTGIPYQATMLRCDAKRKVSRVGRRSGKTDSLCINILHNASTKSEHSILVVCPQKSHAQVIYDRLVELILSSDDLKSSLKRNVKTPYAEIELHNGSIIKLFTSGSRSGSKGDGIRGQSCDALYLDEADYLDPDDLNAIGALLYTSPHVTLWTSSTPRGVRERFYDQCHDSRFREFHYASSVLPFWNDEMDKDARLDAGTEAGYQHEICFAGNTLVRLANGTKKIISDISDKDKVLFHDGQSIDVIKGATLTGIKDIYRYSIPGSHIDCTSNHSFPNRNFKKTQVSELNELPIYNEFLYGNGTRDEILARIVGFNTGDGTVCSTDMRAHFYFPDRCDAENFIKDIKTINIDHSGHIGLKVSNGSGLVKKLGEIYVVGINKVSSKELIDLGCPVGKKVEQEFDVPMWIKNGTKNIKAQYIAGLIGAEGTTPVPSINKKYGTNKQGKLPKIIELKMSKRIDLNGDVFFGSLVQLLSDLDIRSTFNKKASDKDRHVYTLYVYNNVENIKKFFETVGFKYSRDKEFKSFIWSQYLSHYMYVLGEKRKLYIRIKKLRNINRKSYKEINIITGATNTEICEASKKNIVPERLYGKRFPGFYSWTKDRLVDDALFVPITKARKLKANKVYNITVDSVDHSYLLANGIRTFNCAEFGEMVEGVYQNQYVDRAQADFRYEGETKKDGWIYCMRLKRKLKRYEIRLAVLEKIRLEKKAGGKKDGD